MAMALSSVPSVVLLAISTMPLGSLCRVQVVDNTELIKGLVHNRWQK